MKLPSKAILVMAIRSCRSMVSNTQDILSFLTPSLMSPEPKTLIVVDVQTGLDEPQYGRRNNPDAELHIAELLNFWRAKKWAVIFSRYNSQRHDSPLRKNAPGNGIKTQVAPRPGEFIAEKSVNSLFKAAGLTEHLTQLKASELVFVGIATDACVSASVREARDLGYTVWIVADACATFDRHSVNGESLAANLVHEIELGILHSAGAYVCTTSELLRLVKG